MQSYPLPSAVAQASPGVPNTCKVRVHLLTLACGNGARQRNTHPPRTRPHQIRMLQGHSILDHVSRVYCLKGALPFFLSPAAPVYGFGGRPMHYPRRTTPGANNARFLNVSWDRLRKLWCVEIAKAGTSYKFGCFNKELDAARKAAEARASLFPVSGPPHVPVGTPLVTTRRDKRADRAFARFSRLEEAPSPVRVYRPGDADYPA
jgi:hypothetical protein